MVKRTQRAGIRPARPQPETKPAWPLEQHSGEGSASVLETLQKLESHRSLTGKSADPHPADDVDPD